MTAMIAMFCMVGCNNKTIKTVKFYVPDGPPLLAVTQVFGTKDVIEGLPIDSQLVTPAQIEAIVLNGTADIALAPINYCAMARADYTFAGVALMGINYIMSKDDSIESLAGLIGKKVYAYRESGTPGLTLKAAIIMAGLKYNLLPSLTSELKEDAINLYFLAEPTDVASAMKNEISEIKDATYGLLAEPAAEGLVAASNKPGSNFGKVYNKIDIQKVYADNNNGVSFPQVGIIVKKKLIKQNKAFVDAFLKRIEESILFATSQPEQTAAMAIDTIKSSALPPAQIVTKFLKNNGKTAFTYVSAAKAKESVSAYLNKLVEISGNTNIIGGELPNDSFYYAA